MLLVTITVRAPSSPYNLVIEAKDETDFMHKIVAMQRRMARQGLGWYCRRVNTTFWPYDPHQELTPVVAVMPR